jgi:hypothetical protein
LAYLRGGKEIVVQVVLMGRSAPGVFYK